MSVTVQPVVFRGLVWGSPGRPGGGRQRPVVSPNELLAPCREALSGADVRDVLVLDGEQELGKLRKAAQQADMVLVLRPELLSVTWAVKGLDAIDVPIVLYGRENSPGAVIADLYGYLRPDGGDVTLALTAADIASKVNVLAAKKRLAAARALVIGDGFPSWSQVANPTSAAIVKQRLGVEVVQRSIEELWDEYERADAEEAKALAQQWLDGASEVKPEAKADIVEVARVHLAMAKMMAQAQADAVTIDCRMWDEQSMERFGRFYAPCMPLTIFRWEGKPAACEADVNVMLSMMMLSFLADLPTFMGNLATVNPAEGCIEIAHCAATLNMDGIGKQPEPYVLVDYHNRDTGIATYAEMKEGQQVTVARLDKSLDNIAVATGPILEASFGPGCINRIRVRIGDALDYVHNCLTGDHQAVVYGDHLAQVRQLCKALGIGVLEPGMSGQRG